MLLVVSTCHGEAAPPGIGPSKGCTLSSQSSWALLCLSCITIPKLSLDKKIRLTILAPSRNNGIAQMRLENEHYETRRLPFSTNP
eukprot:scaffold595256_cov18-Prasinocladus_malaysianus.AAC.1